MGTNVFNTVKLVREAYALNKAANALKTVKEAKMMRAAIVPVSATRAEVKGFNTDVAAMRGASTARNFNRGSTNPILMRRNRNYHNSAHGQK
ncbi:hypothetical protein PtA15_3A845 [Puccinia triticina]|uniref:Uncharacterized protein n=1 Tax=Puccinia triticina TaxID=208348 RepID=A0ABY7CE44_9BASI|nr:uncharacterized protein PtA15_3A845 [Puccinia triticina]WAQ83474.1 hypothetical protein PtA15_3A845 [Puccinia triticina]WAR54312.1 hypothetical protein PtB15_3B826 [Puccinia triticina]